MSIHLRHDKPLIVYDGACGFCLKQMERIRRWDKRGVFASEPRQSPGLDERFPRLKDGDFNTGMRVILPDGGVRVGADAVYEIARRLWPAKLAAWIYRVPVLHFFCKSIYGWIAANRYKLAGQCETGTCGLPPASSTKTEEASS